MPTIAIVDSGIEKNRDDFDMGARVIDEVVITKLKPNSAGDGRGHGTFVAGIAAGSAKDQAGAAPQANLISLDVMDDSGMARTSDVIAGGRVDLPEPQVQEHQGGELLAALDDAEQLHQRPARQGGREAVVRRRYSRRAAGTTARRTGRAASRTPPATIRS